MEKHVQQIFIKPFLSSERNHKSKIIVSFLICTLPDRRQSFLQLYHKLESQCLSCTDEDNIFEIIYSAKININVGEKRDLLLNKSGGKYVVFIDDDDDIADIYVSSIKEAALSSPDCIGMKGFITTDGANPKNWSISINHGNWHEKDGVYYRTPNHISPILRSIAIKAGFPHVAFAEDYEYSNRVLPMLKTEVFIDKQLYHYKYISKK